MTREKPSPQRGTNPPTRDANAASRVTQALTLRRGKMTYEQIAAKCGYATASAARKAVMRELDRCVSRHVEQLRLEELDSLEALERECWRVLLDKTKEKTQLFAVDRILAIKAQRARLMGLDQTPDAASASATVIIREVPQGYLAAAPTPGRQEEASL